METSELIKRCIRIFYIARKPSEPEYAVVAKVTALGMLLFGLLGFVISVIFSIIS